MTSGSSDLLQAQFVFCLISLLISPLALAGVALINTGLGRSRSAAHALTASLCAVATAVVLFLIIGFRIQGNPPGAILAGATTQPGLFLAQVNQPVAQLAAILSLLSVALSALIPLGATADRLRLGPALLSTAVLAGIVYPFTARFLWRFSSVNAAYLDSGGTGLVHVTGALTALALVWLIGSRRGKYSSSGMPAAIPAHNAVYVLFGCLLSWVGWLGLNSAGSMLYTAASLDKMPSVLLNTTFAAASSSLAAATVTRFRFRRPDASLIGNGWMAGLVAGSAGCALFKPAISVLVGLIAGALVVLSVEWFELHLKVDDPCGSISVHGICGIWGVLATGMLAGSSGQFLAQLAGVSTLLGFAFPLSYALNWLLARFVTYRVSPEGERQGLDLHELGADAYPEFVVHADEFMQR